MVSLGLLDIFLPRYQLLWQKYLHQNTVNSTARLPNTYIVFILNIPPL